MSIIQHHDMYKSLREISHRCGHQALHLALLHCLYSWISSSISKHQANINWHANFYVSFLITHNSQPHPIEAKKGGKMAFLWRGQFPQSLSSHRDEGKAWFNVLLAPTFDEAGAISSPPSGPSTLSQKRKFEHCCWDSTHSFNSCLCKHSNPISPSSSMLHDCTSRGTIFSMFSINGGK